MRRPHNRTPVSGLVLAGDWIRTGLPCTMESATASVWLAAEEVLAELGKLRRLMAAPRPTDGIAGAVRGVWKKLEKGRSFR